MSHESNRHFYDRISRAYDWIADASEHTAREAGLALLSLRPGEHVLEIGFGTGNGLAQMARAIAPEGRVFGLDVSPGMLEVTRAKLEREGLQEAVDLRIGDARELPYGDQAFDAAFASFTLELFALDEIPIVLAELKRVLKPNGRLGIVSMATVPAGQRPSLLERTYIWMHRHFPHIVDCQPIDVERCIADAGYAILQVKELEIWTMPVRAVLATKP